MLNFLFAILVLLNIADIITTVYGLTLPGMIELNPIFNYLFKKINKVVCLVVLKSIILFLIWVVMGIIPVWISSLILGYFVMSYIVCVSSNCMKIYEAKVGKAWTPKF